MTSTAPSPRKNQRAWRWAAYFLILAVLVGIAITLPILYNLNQQLRPDQLDAARERWRSQGPRDYDLTFSIQYDREPLAERHVVLVREGRVVMACCEGELVALSPVLGACVGLPGGAAPGVGRDVPAIFAHLQSLLEEEGSQRNFLVAVFDPQTGWPRRFIRRVRRQSTREEWNLRVWPAGYLEEKARQ